MTASHIHSRRVALGIVRHYDVAYLEQRLHECAQTGSVNIVIHKHAAENRSVHVNVDVQSADQGSVNDFCEFLLANIVEGGTNGSNVSNWTTWYTERVVRFCEWMNARRAFIDSMASFSY